LISIFFIPVYVMQFYFRVPVIVPSFWLHSWTLTLFFRVLPAATYPGYRFLSPTYASELISINLPIFSMTTMKKPRFTSGLEYDDSINNNSCLQAPVKVCMPPLNIDLKLFHYDANMQAFLITTNFIHTFCS